MQQTNMTCLSCGRPILNRKRFEKNVDVKYCSQRCSQEKLDKRDRRLEDVVLQTLKNNPQKNYCPSQISRMFFAESDWKRLHQRTVKACRRLFLSGKIQLMQKGRVLSSTAFKGPFRIRANQASGRE